MLSHSPRFVAALATALLLGGCVADLRPMSLSVLEQPRNEACGRRVLENAVARQHTEDAAPWRSLPAVSVTFEDSYYGLIGAIACPWPEDPCEVEMTFVPGVDTSQARFSDEGVPTLWGIHGWNTWRKAEGQEAVYGDLESAITFWLPTLQYFLEMPFRLAEAEIVDCAGPGEIVVAGKRTAVDQVYLTWGSYVPHPRFDQYLAHVDSTTGFLLRADFTVRDLAGFAKGRVLYGDYRQVGDYWLPHLIQIGTDPPEDMLHELRISAWALDGQIEIPDPSLPPKSKP
ncbi:MAG: hypothetical protein JKY65_07810 [Planctomycetes bacterium]|nr:hypothetical protein [Planctomycetota bacterium]